MPPPYSYWGPHFPNEQTGWYWGGHFPRPSPLVVPPDPPSSGSVLSLALESGTTVRYAWRTSIFKSYSGKESRASRRANPVETYSGASHLRGAATLAELARLRRRAHTGSTFLLALPYEDATLSSDAVGMVVTVPNASALDWASPGQRVLIEADALDGSVEQWSGVIQEVVGNDLTIDDENGTGTGPGSVARPGARVMPLMSVLLDPQQSFGRYPTTDNTEQWTIAASASQFGFAGEPAVAAFLSLAPTVTNSGALEGVELYALATGPDGNGIQVRFSADALTGTGEIVEDVTARTVEIRFSSEETTVENLVALVAASSLIGIRGTYDAAALLWEGDDEFDWLPLAGGQSATPSEAGRGAVVAEYLGKPVWDRGVDAAGTATDSIQSMSEIVDLGGVPAGVGEASEPDWGRAIAITRSNPAEWQWLKRFLWTVRGAWKSWWLPTYRDDLEVLEYTSTTLTIAKTVGDFLAWYPARKQLAVFAGETTVYAEITNVVEAGDTFVLTLSAEIPEPLGVSWLDLVRFERDELEVRWSDGTFSLATSARGVQPSIDETEVREGIEISTPTATYRISTGENDVTIDGRVFRAQTATRGDVGITRVEGSTTDADITLPVSHSVVQRFLQQGFPPSRVSCRVWQQDANGDEVIWQGDVTSCAPERHLAKLRVKSRLSSVLERRLPTVTAGVQCPHILYDENSCRVDRDLFRRQGAVTAINGLTVSVQVTVDEDFATFGEFVHPPTGERRTISKQGIVNDLTGNYAVITLRAPIAELAINDVVEFYAGCDHSMTACRMRFDNRGNFGETPESLNFVIWNPITGGLPNVS